MVLSQITAPAKASGVTIIATTDPVAFARKQFKVTMTASNASNVANSCAKTVTSRHSFRVMCARKSSKRVKITIFTMFAVRASQNAPRVVCAITKNVARRTRPVAAPWVGRNANLPWPPSGCSKPREASSRPSKNYTTPRLPEPMRKRGCSNCNGGVGAGSY